MEKHIERVCEPTQSQAKETIRKKKIWNVKDRRCAQGR